MSLILLFTAGVALGVLAGLLPGIHTNTLQSMIMALHLPIGSEYLAILLASMAFSRLAFEAVPAVLLFIPDEETVASMLPGHRLAREGKAGLALNIYAFSTLASTAFAAVLLPVSLAFLPQAYPILRPLTSLALFTACTVMVLSEKAISEKLSAAACMFLSGALGLVSFGSGLEDPFLPAFTGMFAIPAAIFALKSNTRPPETFQQTNRFDAAAFLPLILIGSLLGAIADLFPGMSSAAQIALFASFFIPLTSEGFLALSASISSSHLLFSLAASSSIGKARTGAAAAIESVLGGLDTNELVMLVGTALIAVSASALLLQLSAKAIAEEFGRIDHRLLNVSVLVLLPLFVYLVDGLHGLLLFAASSATGALPLIAGCKRIHLMGFILLPALANALNQSLH